MRRGVVMVLALVACTDILAPSGRQLTPADTWLYEIECIEWVPSERLKEFQAQVPNWYFDRCDPYHIVSYTWVGSIRVPVGTLDLRRSRP